MLWLPTWLDMWEKILSVYGKIKSQKYIFLITSKLLNGLSYFSAQRLRFAARRSMQCYKSN